MAVRFAFLTVASVSLAFVAVPASFALASPVGVHSVLMKARSLASTPPDRPQNLIFIDSESDDEACDPGEDCSGDAKSEPKHDKKSDKKKKTDGGSSSSNEDCDPGEDCSSDSD